MQRGDAVFERGKARLSCFGHEQYFLIPFDFPSPAVDRGQPRDEVDASRKPSFHQRLRDFLCGGLVRTGNQNNEDGLHIVKFIIGILD